MLLIDPYRITSLEDVPFPIWYSYVVRNMFFFQLTNIFQRVSNHQPATVCIVCPTGRMWGGCHRWLLQALRGGLAWNLCTHQADSVENVMVPSICYIWYIHSIFFKSYRFVMVLIHIFIYTSITCVVKI